MCTALKTAYVAATVDAQEDADYINKYWGFVVGKATVCPATRCATFQYNCADTATVQRHIREFTA